MRHLDLFSGIGGFALAAQWARITTIGFSEIDPYASRVLKKHWPSVPNHGDIRTIQGRAIGHVDIITGGFPCQPFSTASAGKRKGKSDDRYLWPEMRRVIEECQPAWVCGENVAGIDGMAFEQVVSDLEAIGFEVQPLVIPACAFGFDHWRPRYWFLGYAHGNRKPSSTLDEEMAVMPKRGSVPGVVGDSHGVSGRMDRLRCLGNAIVPQVAHQILQAIKSHHIADLDLAA